MNRSALVVLSVSLMIFCFAGCDYAERRAVDAERADGLYRTAMAEYAAGRLDKSIAAFEKVLAANPANASARFQLACLLQDHRKDLLGAICNYREYMALSAHGDKVGMAKERAGICERQLATVLSGKYNLGGSVAQGETNARLQAENARLSSELEKAKRQSEQLQGDLDAARRENDRVRRMVLAAAVDDEDAPAADAQTSANGGRPQIPDEKDLADDETADIDRVKFSADVANLISEEKDETSQVAPFGQTVRRQRKESTGIIEPPHEKRPEYYVVQEGDTLFKLAMRFYGRRSAWTYIRDANKTVVSADGRIRAGQKLRMP